MDLRRATAEAVGIGILAGGWMNSSYWHGHGVICGIVVGALSWVLIVTRKKPVR